MAKRLTITLEDAEATALVALAQREKRDLRQQVAMMIRNELERLGFLPADAHWFESRPGLESPIPAQQPGIDPAPVVLHQAPPPAIGEDAADVLARVYALILSWPTAEEKTHEAAASGDNV